MHTGSAETFQYNLQLGTRKSLDNDSVGFSEAWYRLLQALGMAGSLAHSTGVTFADYSTNSFALAADTEKNRPSSSERGKFVQYQRDSAEDRRIRHAGLTFAQSMPFGRTNGRGH